MHSSYMLVNQHVTGKLNNAPFIICSQPFITHQSPYKSSRTRLDKNNYVKQAYYHDGV